MKRVVCGIVAVLGASLPLAACGGKPQVKRQPTTVPEDIFADRLGDPLPSASDEQLETFEHGREVARHRFTRETGLGPHFNVASCTACHEKPTTGGSADRYRNFVLQGQKLSDGSFQFTGVKGIQPHYSLDPDYRVADDEKTNRRALRNPIPFFGVGLVAEINEREILKNADPDDADGDGISGRPNYDQGFVGRFGRKAQTVSLEGFIRGPLFNHGGITTNPLSAELQAQLPVPSVAFQRQGDDLDEMSLSGLGSKRQAQAAAPAEPNFDEDEAPDPEMPEQDLFDLVSFSMLLAAPRPDDPTDDSIEGERLFDSAGCNGCHVRGLLSPRGLIPLYSDLLLHDMGEDLADGIVMGEAKGYEFKTQPLWGVSAVGPYLHNGAADTLDEAIRMHGGEAEAARNAYLDLSRSERALIITFLESLGGSSQRSEGLLDPNAPVPEAGDFGGPIADLDAEDLDLFMRGRVVFDRATPISAGLGTTFNGDSCRACHFDPVIGGAGPKDVDVTRQGIVDDNGEYVDPVPGTMVHHQSLKPERPSPDEHATHFEHRQTPPLFGMGLIDQIPEATILALQDPDDEDGDGVRGIANVLADGRVGRLGWKADVPSLAEFTRDGLTNEIGVTVPSQDNLTFGRAEDDDGIDDPEATRPDMEALNFFMSQLAPPPRTRTDRALENEGEGIFADIGCATCHVPELETDDGTPVHLYSDLLLHQVMPADYLGIGDGLAGMRDFRTSPLWGLSSTAPYMHNGLAFTLEEAIHMHAGEARGARNAFDDLSRSDREALIAFLNSL